MGVAMADDGASKKVDVYDGVVDYDGAPETIDILRKSAGGIDEAAAEVFPSKSRLEKCIYF